MCEVCAIFGAGEHWSDFSRQRNERFPFEDIQHDRNERRRRIAVLNTLLDPIKLDVGDWDGETLVINDEKGRLKLAPTLGDVWQQVEALSGMKVDPLAKGFLRGGAGV